MPPVAPSATALAWSYVGSMADYYYEARKQDKLLRKHAKENKVRKIDTKTYGACFAM